MTKPADILILGGSGFLSGTLANAARARGARVWALTRGQRPVPAGVVGLVADRHDHAAFAQAIAGARTQWDLVVDCIAFEPGDVEQDVATFTTLARHLVYVSTDFVYDPARRMFPQREDSEHYAAEGYGGKKRQGEVVLARAETGDMGWTILRPCHIYGPGSKLGCLPLHGRDANLITRLQAGEPLQLVGGGHFLQQPILARDLAELILSLAGNRRVFGQVLNAAGPDIVESREYYRIIADVLGVEMRVAEAPVSQYRSEHPESAPFLCHRIYDLTRLRAAGVAVPATPLAQGLCEHVESLMNKPSR
jgi:nucleoside-diphosphate-sugar epimerase